ncbi:MAG TPA: SpoIIE family protein phosphatase [Clostridiales bacterium]|nr:SpoIIE family protein phosphatase [Clostridiales bacterium]
MLKETARLGRLGEAAGIHNNILALTFYILAFTGGFILARTPVMDQMLPLGLMFTAGLPKFYALAAGIGAFCGYFLPVGGIGAFRYITAIFAVLSIKMLLQGFRRLSDIPLFSAGIGLVTSAVTGAAAIASTGSPSAVVLVAAESILTGGGAYFIHRAVRIRRHNRLGLSGTELASVVILISILLMGLIPIHIGELSLGRICALVMVLAAARFGKEQAGAVAGICSGFVIALSDRSFLFAIGVFAFGGLCAGLFSQLGKLGSALAFVLSGGLVLILAGVDMGVLSLMLEVLASSVIFLFLPRRLGIMLAEVFAPPVQLPRLDGLRKSLVMRLEFAANALSDVSQTVEEVAERLRRINAPDFDDVLRCVEQDACKGCTLRINCWETDRAATLSALLEMTKAIKQGIYEAETAAPEEFASKCLRLSSVGRSLFTHFSDYISKQSAENRIKEVRSVVSDQFDGISNMLYDLSEEFEHAQRYDTDTAGRIVQALKDIGIITSDCACVLDKYGRMAVEIRIRNAKDITLNRVHILRQVSGVCEREFDPPCINEVSGEVFITLCERAVYSVEYGVSQLSCTRNRMCGDAYSYFSDGKGHSIMIISDGMGNGGRAAVDGAMAAGLMSRLLKAGFGFDCSLRIVNSAMLFKSTDESLATIDIASIDLYTGKVELYKAGAAPTLVRRSGRVGKAESSSLPAGIIRDIGFDKAMVSLNAGDIVLMLSDGAITEGLDWIYAELEAWRDGTAQELADHIAEAARRRRSDGHEDDITVMAAILHRAV